MSGSEVSRLDSQRPDVASWGEVLPLCEGFRVESSDGRVGVVSSLRYAPSARRDFPSWLGVRAGRSSDMLLIVPVAEIEGVFLAEGRIVLRPSPQIEATERVSSRRRAGTSRTDKCRRA
jgi:hypothetical protein